MNVKPSGERMLVKASLGCNLPWRKSNRRLVISIAINSFLSAKAKFITESGLHWSRWYFSQLVIESAETAALFDEHEYDPARRRCRVRLRRPPICNKFILAQIRKTP